MDPEDRLKRIGEVYCWPRSFFAIVTGWTGNPGGGFYTLLTWDDDGGPELMDVSEGSIASWERAGLRAT